MSAIDIVTPLKNLRETAQSRALTGELTPFHEGYITALGSRDRADPDHAEES
jgi:hypothetical protein